MSTRNKSVVLLASAARTASGNTGKIENPAHKGVRFCLTIASRSGTSPTLDIKVQAVDKLGNAYDMTGCSFAQKNAAGSDMLVIVPGIAASANKAVSDALPRIYQVVWTIGGTATPTFTFSLTAEYIG